jgi:membrane-anchored mycosin MYCP
VTTARAVCPFLVAVLVSQCATAPAHAVTPPAVDEKWLPAAALPSPPQRTVQRETCTVATAAPEDAGAPAQLAGFDLPQLWQFTRGAGQRVAVIDTGVHHHPRLNELIAGGDYVGTGDGTQDCDAHGTLVAGIIAATTGPDFTGIAPDVALISIRQSSSKFSPAANRSGAGVGDVATLARAVRTAADLGATVINISSVACTPADQPPDDRALGAALAYAVDVKNAVVVAAAGNSGGGTQCPPQPAGVTYDSVAVVVSPAWYDDYVLTVGSVNSQGVPSTFTLAGPWVDVAATAEGVISLAPAGDGLVNRLNGQSPVSGTSYAVPVVSGLAALIRARFPTLTARQVMQRIEATAHHPPAGWDPFVGNGTVDALAALTTDTPQAVSPGTKPLVNPAPVTSSTPDYRSRMLTGTAICLVVLLAALARSRRSGSRRDHVAGD